MNSPFLRPSRPAGRPDDVAPFDDEQLPARLGADVERGFAPDPKTLARVRVQVTAEFRRRAGEPAAAPLTGIASRRTWLPALRPLASFGLAAAVLLGSFGLVAANSGPGDPFYGLRLAAEDLDLPVVGRSSHLDRLQQRLDEARRESADGAALSAALEAYRDELQRALAEAQDDGQRKAILDALDVHQVVLDQLQKTVPDAASAGLEQARDQLGEAQQGLRGKSSPPQESPSPAGTPRPGDSHKPSNR